MKKFRTDMEQRGRSPSTFCNCHNILRDCQNYHDKPADQLREAEIGAYIHHLLTERRMTDSHVTVWRVFGKDAARWCPAPRYG